MITKIQPDKERAKSIIKMMESREKLLSAPEIAKFSTILAETYYEIIKELITAIFFCEGIKTIGEYAHKELIEHLSNYSEFSKFEIEVIDDLRIRRNKSSYEGKQIEKSYIDNKKDVLAKIILKLKNLLEKKLK